MNSVFLQILALGFTSSQATALDANHFDLSTKYASTLISINNTFAAIPGIVGVYLSGWMLQQTNDNWSSIFLLASAVAVAGCVLYLILGTADPIDFDRRGVGCCNGSGFDLDAEEPPSCRDSEEVISISSMSELPHSPSSDHLLMSIQQSPSQSPTQSTTASEE